MSLLPSVIAVFALAWCGEDPPLSTAFEVHPRAVLCVATSPDGKLVVTGSEDPIVRVFDAKDRAALRTLEGNDGDVTALAFSRDGTLLAVGDYYKKVRLWNTATWTVTRTLEVGGIVTALAFTADGKGLFIAHKDNAVSRFDLTAAEDAKPRAYTHAFEVCAMVLSADDATLWTGDGAGTITAWSTADGEKLWFRTQGAEVVALALFDSGKTLACGSRGTGVATFDAESGDRTSRFQAGDLEASALAVSRDGKTLFVGTREGPVHALESLTGKDLGTIVTHDSIVTGLLVSGGGTTVVSTSRDASVRVSPWPATGSTKSE
jgi:WD40 repeat protein